MACGRRAAQPSESRVEIGDRIAGILQRPRVLSVAVAIDRVPVLDGPGFPGRHCSGANPLRRTAHVGAEPSDERGAPP